MGNSNIVEIKGLKMINLDPYLLQGDFPKIPSRVQAVFLTKGMHSSNVFNEIGIALEKYDFPTDIVYNSLKKYSEYGKRDNNSLGTIFLFKEEEAYEKFRTKS